MSSKQTILMICLRYEIVDLNCTLAETIETTIFNNLSTYGFTLVF